MVGDSGVHDDIQDEAFADLQWWPRRGLRVLLQGEAPRVV